MNVVIIEDELPAADKFERYLKRYDPEIQVSAKLATVEKSKKWLRENQDTIDLIFLDIQLMDGQSFEILKSLDIRTPIIFTTAYDEYALEAFKYNSVDYLLKPITFSDLENALGKFSDLKKQLASSPDYYNDIGKLLAGLESSKQHKSRFMVKLGEHIRSIPASEIALFFADGRIVYLVTHKNNRFTIDFKLEELEHVLDPHDFFRINRTYIVNISAIADVIVYSNSRLKIDIKNNLVSDLIVSRERVNHFKEWFDR